MFTNRFATVTATFVVAVACTANADGEDTPGQAVSVELFPLPANTTFERHVVTGEGVDVTTGVTEQLIYSNTLGTYGVSFGSGKFAADDITTTVPGGCKLRRYEFPVVGKVNPAGAGGTYTVDFAMYSSCPGSVPSASRAGLIIPGTQGQRTFTDQCQNATDNDGDTLVNDGCPAVGPAETEAQCLNATDDDGDGKVNDGCPADGDPETDNGSVSVPRLISFVPTIDAPLPTNFWFGVKFSRSNAGVVFGAPPLTGFSCDQFDFLGIPCNAWAGGFPEYPHASFNLEIFADSACANSYTGYKNDKPSIAVYNPGADIFLADDIVLSASGCNMIAYEVAVRGQGFYTFRMQRNCGSNLVPGTEQTFPLFGTENPTIARFTFDPPIAIPQVLSFEAKVNIPISTVGVVIAGQQACIGSTTDRLDRVVGNVCTQVPAYELGSGTHGAFSLTITCAGVAPVGACCDMYVTDEDGDAVCREVPQTNCPFPARFTTDQPVWVEGASCEPDPFPLPCGVAACCRPDQVCENLTQNECNAVPPFDYPRQWQLGRYCDQNGQSCPWIACLARTGECTFPRCTLNGGVCDLRTHTCSAGMIGKSCTSDFQCHCPDNGCQVNSTCCDSCPPVGCENPECCTNVCNLDVFCCLVEWDDKCVSTARTGTYVVNGVEFPICEIRPANDVCAPLGRLEGARLITDVPPSSAESDSGRATADADDPGFGCYLDNPGAQGLQTVWYKFVASTNSALLRTCNSDSPANDSLLAVFAVGDPSTPVTQCDSLIPIGCGDDFAGCSYGGKNSKLCVNNLIPGNLYYVMVASKVALAQGKAYRLDISASCISPPPTIGDSCPDAQPILDGTTAFMSNLAATESESDPGFCCRGDAPGEPGFGTVWFKFTATNTSARVSTCNSNPADDSLIQVFAAGDPSSDEGACNGLTMIGCSDDVEGCSTSGRHGRVCIKGLTPGDTYYVMVAAKTPETKGLYQLDIRLPCFDEPIWIAEDCNGNGLQDGCELGSRVAADCNGNHVLDECDIASGGSFDCDANAFPDECTGPIETLRPPSPAINGGFGHSVDMQGEWLVIGTSDVYVEPTGGDSLHIYRRTPAGWRHAAEFPLPDAPAYVDLDGVWIVTASDHDSVAHLFRVDGEEWVEAGTLQGPEVLNCPRYGFPVAVHGDTIALGKGFCQFGMVAPPEEVYIFRFDGAQWIEEARISAPDPSGPRGFGASVSLDGDRLLVGAPYGEAAYIFRRVGEAWEHEATLTPADVQQDNFFGRSSVLKGEWALVGATVADSTGAVYVFRQKGILWSQSTKLVASDASSSARFGWSVGIAGNTTVIGAVYVNAAYIFHRRGTQWIEQAKLSPPTDEYAEYFGHGVATDGALVAVGWPGFDSAYVFQPPKADCNENDIPDLCDVRDGRATDCNHDDVPDVCTLTDGTTPDCNHSGVPDDCETLPPFDYDFDSDVDLFDLAGFQRCFTGPGPAKLAPCCTVFDSEPDGDVDLADFVAFRGVFSGP